jgi:hypothetical protein
MFALCCPFIVGDAPFPLVCRQTPWTSASQPPVGLLPRLFAPSRPLRLSPQAPGEPKFISVIVHNLFPHPAYSLSIVPEQRRESQIHPDCAADGKKPDRPAFVPIHMRLLLFMHCQTRR